MKKNLTAMVLAAAMTAGLTAGAFTVSADDAQTFTVGVSQFVQHPALDAATQGFMDALTEEFGDRVTFDVQNAAGDAGTTITIAQNLVAEEVDLILANATPSLASAASATVDIPILGTAVTDYATALQLENFDGTVGGNISGTADLAPLDKQAEMIRELVPDAEKLGILYCSAEANSKFQAEQVKTYAEELGLEVAYYTFSDSNDVTTVTQTACDECDVLYIPTDNTAASCTEAINNVALPAGVPIIAGEEGIMSGCGIATLSISYYNLGKTTGEMAVRILNGEENISEMPVAYDTDPVKEYNPELVEALGIEIPEDYIAYGVEEADSSAESSEE